VSAIGTHVGSKVLFENKDVRVWEFTLKPGEWSDWHRHEHDYVIAYVTDAELGLQVADAPPETTSVADGYVSHTSVGSAADQRLTHRLGNLGEQPLRHLVIEILGTRREQSTPMRMESNDPAEMLQDTHGGPTTPADAEESHDST
jgi:beta-alanine degradation protein BauB